MTFDNKRVISIALATALLGGTVGAFVSRSGKTETAQTAGVVQTAPAQATTPSTTAGTDLVAQNTENNAYRDGFADGVRLALEEGKNATTIVERQGAPSSRVSYRNTRSSGRSAGRSYNNSSRVYYDYEQPRKRSFWSKHRDKLTVAMGTGAGAGVGALIGGKKGALIGALAGAGGSALYTYKLRNRTRRY